MDVYQRRRLVALSTVVGVFVIVVLAIASGGDDENGPTAVTGVTGATGAQGELTLGKQQYINQADDSCEEANASLETIDQADPATAAEQETEVMSNLLQTLRALPPPENQATLAERFLDALEEQVDLLRSREVAVARGDQTSVATLDAELPNAEAEAQAIAQDFGFEVCGNPEAVTDPADEGTAEPVDPAAPVEPAPEEAPPPAPPPEEPPPDDGTGGVSPGDDDSGGISP